MPKIDLSAIPTRQASAYPGDLAAKMAGRSTKGLSGPGGLTQFGANMVELAPGALSSLRHWHEKQDEFLVVLDGPLALIEDDGETTLQTGDCAAFPAGNANGHHLVNKTDSPKRFVVIGTHTDTEVGYYSDVDMMVRVEHGTYTFTKRDGSPVAAITDPQES